MFETMYAAPGVGLAAPQVNVSKRVFVMDVHDDEHEPAVVINPKIEQVRGRARAARRLPVGPRDGRRDRTLQTRRGQRGSTAMARRSASKVTAYFAQCLQHEIDHLDGKLYIDRATNVRPAVTEEEKEAAEA